MVKIETGGQQDIHFDNYDENISVTKTNICAKNIIWGGLYVDAEGIVEAVNHKTGERFEVQYYPKEGKNKEMGKLTGQGYDA